MREVEEVEKVERVGKEVVAVTQMQFGPSGHDEHCGPHWPVPVSAPSHRTPCPWTPG